MIELFGNAWELQGDVLCITSNGAVRRDGACVMGRGIAREAAVRYPQVPYVLGERIHRFGNRVLRIGQFGSHLLYSFPVKHSWEQPADLVLIQKSCAELMEAADYRNFSRILLPRPGCGNGKLEWSAVREVIAPLLDDRIAIVHWKKEETPDR